MLYNFSIMTKEAISVWSGGKDSALAYFLALNLGHKPNCLFYMNAGLKHSDTFHDLSRIRLLNLQAKSIGLPIYRHDIKISLKKPKDLDKKFFEGIKKANKLWPCKNVVIGCHEMPDQCLALEKRCREMGLRAIEPLFKMPLKTVLDTLLESKIKALITGVEPKYISENWLGKFIDERFIKYLAKRKNLCGGEFQTLVINAPFFDFPIKIEKSFRVKTKDQTFLSIQGKRPTR
jgi:uncharacterized protein (TIGR00290 family)